VISCSYLYIDIKYVLSLATDSQTQNTAGAAASSVGEYGYVRAFIYLHNAVIYILCVCVCVCICVNTAFVMTTKPALQLRNAL